MLKQSIIELYDEYTHSGLPSIIFGRDWPNCRGTTAALALLPVLENKSSMAQVVVEQDVRMKTGDIEVPTPNGPIQAYFAKPKNSGKRPAVIMIYENRGLNPVDVSFYIF